jgi:hypothetical protein
MNATENSTNEAPKTSKRHFDTMDESIAKMKLAFGNASLPQIFVVMVTVGYTAEKIAALNAELAQLETLYQAQIKEYGEEGEEQQLFSDKRIGITKVFNQNRALLRILFKGNVKAWVTLQLDVETPKALPIWTPLVKNFYDQLIDSPDLLSAAETVGVTKAVITNQKQALDELETLKKSLRKETGEAQAATNVRDTAFDTLYPKYTEYIKYAKILLPDNQLLEALGITVK